ncbi:MAG TPA: hypothetical protein VGX96_07150 [Candidatus Elarobacter sp.]|nr:hypothetical protein [Candidatus Elarobacter sp.]
MVHRSRFAFVAAAVLVAPAALGVVAAGLSVAGIRGPSKLFDAAFAILGVTNTSPLPLRQAWYFGAFILAPLAGAAVALVACAGTRASVRWALGALTACGTLVAAFWIVWSLVDPD